MESAQSYHVDRNEESNEWDDGEQPGRQVCVDYERGCNSDHGNPEPGDRCAMQSSIFQIPVGQIKRLTLMGNSIVIDTSLKLLERNNSAFIEKGTPPDAAEGGEPSHTRTVELLQRAFLKNLTQN